MKKIGFGNKFEIALSVTTALLAVSSNAAMASPHNYSAIKIAGNQKAKAIDEAQDVLDAKALLDGGSTQASESKMASFLRSNPENTSARILHAESLYKLGRFHFASDEIALALNDKPDNAQAVLLSAQINQRLHRPQQAIEMYQKFLQLNPKDEHSSQYEALISVLSNEATQQKNKRSNVASGTDNYLLAVCTGSYQRWKDPRNIKVHVVDGTGVPEYRPEFEESLRQAFEDWSQSTNGKLAFVFVPDAAAANMTVNWSNDLHAPKFVAEGGYATTRSNAEGLEKADIQLLTVDPLKDGPIGTNYLYNLCLHEIGHSLGLVGHSPNPDDIMSTTLISQQGLSPRDIRTILALYSADLNAPLPMVDEYGRPLSNKAKAERLANEAFAALDAQNFQLGVDKYEQALKLDPKTPNAKENIAVALNNLGIADGTDPNKAVEYFRRALYYNPGADYVRGNLNSYLQSKGIDPKSATERAKLGDQFAAKHENIFGFVEYGESLRIKDDPAVKAKRDGLHVAAP